MEDNNTIRVLKPGAVFGNYTIVKLLGQGGMGAVFLVRHNVLDTLFALKVLYPAAVKKNRNFVDRFIREAKLAGKIRHSNLIAVHDAGRNTEHDLYYIVMDYVSGGSVRDLLKKEHRLDPQPALDIIIQVTMALCAAYENHMVHRDIKPDNIMFTSEGTVKLADLGIAKSTDDQDTTLTITSAVFGTPAYMSPEQAVDSGKVDIRADIYSLGIVFYEMLTGQRPYRGDSSMEILAQVVAEAEVPDIRVIRPQIPAELAELIAAMTAKSLAKRIQTPAELLRRLENIRIPADWDKTGSRQTQLSDLTAESADGLMKTIKIGSPAQFQTPASAEHREKTPEGAAASPDVPAAEAASNHSKPGTGSSIKKLSSQKQIFLLVSTILLAILLLLISLWLIAGWKSGRSNPLPPAKVNGPNGSVLQQDRGITVKPRRQSDVVLPGTAIRLFKNTASQPDGQVSAASPEISSDPLSGNQIVLLAGNSGFARGIKAGLVQSFGNDKVSFQAAENMGGSQALLKSIIKSSPSVVVIAFGDKYVDDHISVASFENLIQHHADQLRDSGIKFMFVLAPESENDRQTKAFNQTIRDLCKLRSIPLVQNGSQQNADLTKTIRDLYHQ